MVASGVAILPFAKEISVNKLIALLAVLGLSGCAAYGVPYGSADVYYGGSPYYSGSPYYYGSPYGSPYYGSSSVYIYGSGGHTYAPRYRRDRDHDGIPDRRDRDRDGDGVPNRRDAYPGDPRRY
jgi:hypothetical protein